MSYDIPTDFDANGVSFIASLTSCINCNHEVAVMADGTVKHFWESHYPYNAQGVAQACGYKVVYRLGTAVPEKHSQWGGKSLGKATMYQCRCSNPQVDDGEV